MRILVTGASGMLGKYLSENLSKNHQVYGIGTNQIVTKLFHYKVFDLKNKNYNSLIEWSKPEIVIHCAAITNGNYCESNYDDAFSVNAFSTKKLIDSTDISVKIIYISTDAVFGGEAKLNTEKDFVNPQNIYAKSKELSEFFLSNSNKKFVIIRTTIIGFSTFSESFLDWIINSSISNEEITLFDDVIFNPITIWDLSNEIEFLIANKNFDRKIFHIAGSETVTKYDFGLRLLKNLNLGYKKIQKGSIKNFKKRAKRATDQSLSVKFYQDSLYRKLPDIESTLNTIKSIYYEKN